MGFAKDLLFNVTILTSYIAISNQISHGKFATPSSSLLYKILTGISGGLLGCLLILCGIEVVPQVNLDLRLLPIIILFIYTNYTSAIIASLIIGCFRILLVGITPSSTASLITIIFTCISCAFIRKMKTSRIIKWVLSLLAYFFILCCMFTYLIPDKSLLRTLLIDFFVSMSVCSFLIYLLLEDIRKANRNLAKTKFYAQKDSLTGLNNVRQFDKLFYQISQEAVQQQKNLSFLFLDIDFFKKVNDTYGHMEGNNILIELCKILIKNCREMDIISRNGGEEFSVILPSCSQTQAIEAAERIRKAVEQHKFPLLSGQYISITISIGVACFPTDTSNALELMEHADEALYNAKNSGRNRVCVYQRSKKTPA